MGISLEAVTVCVGYADFLKETAPYNSQHIDHWVIVTTEDDHDTRELCRRYNLKCVLTDKFYRHGPDTFSKSAGIDLGLDQLSQREWVLHLDADIVLPSLTRHCLSQAHLQEDKLYGCDRLMVRSWEQWQKIKATSWIQNHHDYSYRICIPEGLQVGERWSSVQHGYVPCGYFQLWHGDSQNYNGITARRYPTTAHTAARSDIQHGLQWDRRDRLLLPEVLVLHLDSQTSKLGANWNGRRSPPFGPAKPVPATPASPVPSGHATTGTFSDSKVVQVNANLIKTAHKGKGKDKEHGHGHHEDKHGHHGHHGDDCHHPGPS